jgi:hypothetical protein
LTNNESIPNDEGKKELDEILNNTPEAEDLFEHEYDTSRKRGFHTTPLVPKMLEPRLMGL